MAVSNNKLPISLQNLGVFREEIVDDILTKVATLNTNAEEAKHKADIARSAALSAGATETVFVLPSANWAALNRTYGDYKYSAEIAVSGITAQYTVNVIFDMNSIEVATSYKIAPTCNVATDSITVYSKKLVDRELTGVVVYGQCASASGVGRTNVCLKNSFVPNGGAWDNKDFKTAKGTSTMVRIPAMTWKELGVGDSDELFPAFIVNGDPVKTLWIGKYLANSVGCSVKGAEPKTFINFNDSQTLCKNMGEGWHLNTRLTWVAVALWCAKHNRQPVNTTDPYNTGKMDATHSHNGLESGIWDMAGCNNEWNAGMRFVQGELQVISSDGITFDNSAIILDSSATSSNWRCIDGLTGSLMRPNGSGTTANSLKMNNGQWVTNTASDCNKTIDDIKVDSNICERAKNMLIALGMLLPAGMATDGDKIYTGKGLEHIPFAGGSSNAKEEGVFYTYCTFERSDSRSNIGLRAAFCEL